MGCCGRSMPDSGADGRRFLYHLLLHRSYWRLLSALVSESIYLQLFAFAVFSIIALVYVRPFAKRYLHKGEDTRVSNADALMGRQGKVVEVVKADGFGRVQIDGDIWKAVTNEVQDIPVGTTVHVVGRESTIITVETININH